MVEMDTIQGRAGRWTALIAAAALAPGLPASSGRVLANPNLVANGDLEQPAAKATARLSPTENATIFEFAGDKHFGRVIARGTFGGSQLAEELVVRYAQIPGYSRGLLIDAKEVKFTGEYDISVWFDLKGRIRPNRQYAYSVVCLPGENKTIPPLEMIVPSVWSDGQLTGATISLAWGDDLKTADDYDKRGVVKTPDFTYQTGSPSLVLKLPKSFKDQLFIVNVSLREIDENLLRGEKSAALPIPTRYVAIEDLLEERIEEALTRTTEVLKATRNPDGYWSGTDLEMSVALTATVLDSLAGRGEDLTTREMKASMQWLSEQEVTTTASLAARLSFFSNHGVADYRQTIAADLLKLIDAQFTDGGWSDSGKPNAETENRTLHSNNIRTMTVVLALREAHYAGFKADLRTWRQAAAYFRDAQARDGGFRAMMEEYGGLGEATTTQNTAFGLAGLLMTLDVSYAADARYCTQYLSNSQHLGAIDRAIEWLDEYYDEYYKTLPTLDSPSNPFFNAWGMLLVIEQSGLTRFKDKDVFRTEAEHILEPGLYDSGSGLFGGSLTLSAFALHLLEQGSAPIVFQRVIVGDPSGHEWSRDGDHLVRYLRAQRHKMVNWRVADMDLPVEELVRVPILYVNVVGEMKGKKEHWRKLRDYCFAGGVAVFNVAEDNESSRKTIEEGLKETFPDYALADLKPDDPIMTIKHKLTGLDQMRVIGNGLKNFVYLTTKDWSCRLGTHQVDEHAATFQFFDNLLEYTLDGGQPRSSSLPSTWEAGTATSMDVQVARMEVGSDVIAYPELIATLDRIMQSEYKLKVKEVPAGDASSDARLLWLSCAGGTPMTDSQRQDVNAWIERGAFLFAEVLSGNREWGEHFRAELQKLEGEIRIRKLPANHPILNGQFDETYGFDVRVVELRRALADEYEKLPRIEIYLIEKDGEEVGAFTVHDVGSGLGYVLYPGCRGVIPAESRHLAANVILYSMQRALH